MFAAVEPSNCGSPVIAPEDRNRDADEAMVIDSRQGLDRVAQGQKSGTGFREVAFRLMATESVVRLW
jgi:hypothetical protein